MALDVLFVVDVERRMAGTLLGMLRSAQAQGGLNIEFCRGAIVLAEANVIANKGSWKEVSSIVESSLDSDPELLETLWSNKLLTS